jgi:hypothetical protein
LDYIGNTVFSLFYKFYFSEFSLENPIIIKYH